MMSIDYIDDVHEIEYHTTPVIPHTPTLQLSGVARNVSNRGGVVVMTS